MRVAEDRRGRDVAKKPSVFAETAQSGSIRRPEQQGKGYRTWQKCENPAGPYFEPLPDWQYKAGIAPRGIVIAPGDTIIPQIANRGTPQDGGFYMIFQASNVSTTMATLQVNFFDSKGESMNMPLPRSPDDLTGTLASGFQGASPREVAARKLRFPTALPRPLVMPW